MKSEKIFNAVFELGPFGLPVDDVEYIIRVLESYKYLSKRDGLGLPHVNVEDDTEPTGKVTNDQDQFEIHKGTIRFTISLACLPDGNKLAEALNGLGKAFNCIVRQKMTVCYW